MLSVPLCRAVNYSVISIVFVFIMLMILSSSTNPCVCVIILVFLYSFHESFFVSFFGATVSNLVNIRCSSLISNHCIVSFVAVLSDSVYPCFLSSLIFLLPILQI